MNQIYLRFNCCQPQLLKYISGHFLFFLMYFTLHDPNVWVFQKWCKRQSTENQQDREQILN